MKREITFKDLQRMLDRIDLKRIFNDEPIFECEAYRIARARSKAQGAYVIYI